MGTTARRRSRPPVWPNCSGSTCWICFRTCPTWRPLPTNPDRGHRRVRVRATANPDPIGNLDFFSFFLFFFFRLLLFLFRLLLLLVPSHSASDNLFFYVCLILFCLEFFYFFNSGFLSSFFFFAHINNIHSRKICNYKKKKSVRIQQETQRACPISPSSIQTFFFSKK